MADFCRDCSIANFGRDFRDFANKMPHEGYSNEPGKSMGALVLCECCGPVVVDINGRRLQGQEFCKECSCAIFTAKHTDKQLKEMREEDATNRQRIHRKHHE